MRRTIFIAVIVVVLVAVAATWKYLSSREPANRLVLSGTVEADEIHVGSKVGGRVAAVLVKEGQDVSAGQPLIRFEAYDLEAKRSEAQASVAQAESNLQKTLNLSRPEEIAEARAQAEAARMALEQAQHGPRSQEIDVARADLKAAEADYEVARVSLTRIEQLVASGIASRQDYDNAKASFDRASAQREAARDRLALLQAGTRPEEIARAEQLYKQAAARKELVERGARKEDVQAARAQLDLARATLDGILPQLAELDVKSPANASVEVLQVRPGDLITPSSPVATLVEVDRLWVRVFVPEPELGYVQLGKEVSVHVDSFPNESFSGRVEQIASRGEFTPRNVQTREERTHMVFSVRLRLDNTQRRLRAGMAADVLIPR